MSEILMCVCGP